MAGRGQLSLNWSQALRPMPFNKTLTSLSGPGHRFQMAPIPIGIPNVSLKEIFLFFFVKWIIEEYKFLHANDIAACACSASTTATAYAVAAGPADDGPTGAARIRTSWYWRSRYCRSYQLHSAVMREWWSSRRASWVCFGGDDTTSAFMPSSMSCCLLK